MACALGHKACKPAEEVRPGDLVKFLGDSHLISKIDPYDGPFDFVIGIARDDDGWGFSLAANGCVEVASVSA